MNQPADRSTESATLEAEVPDPTAELAGRADESPVGKHLEPETKGRIVIPRVTMPEPTKGPDKVFAGLTTTTGVLIVVLIAAIALFLLASAAGPLSRNEVNFLTSREWSISDQRLAFGIAALLWTTVISSIVAMVIAVPVAMGVALLITHYAPPRIGRTVGFLVDLLAAVPSIVYGLWGARVFAPWLKPVGDWLTNTLGFIPLFKPGVTSAGTVFAASLVLAIMILPIITSISRDVFDQTPRDNIEAAWALGATKWEMIRLAVIPYGRSGSIAAAMLGLGRALGETIAVMLILSTVPGFSWSLFSGGQTFASLIARGAPEFDSPTKAGAYIAAGLVLFILTFAVNGVARLVASGKKG